MLGYEEPAPAFLLPPSRAGRGSARSVLGDSAAAAGDDAAAAATGAGAGAGAGDDAVAAATAASPAERAALDAAEAFDGDGYLPAAAAEAPERCWPPADDAPRAGARAGGGSRLICAVYLQAPKPLCIALPDGGGGAGSPHASGDHCGPAANVAAGGAAAAAAAAAVVGARSVHLGMMVVSPELKRRGMGARLLASALATARARLRADVVDIHVVSVKPWLSAFYEKVGGFALAGRAEWPEPLRPLLKPAYAGDMHFGVYVKDLRASK